MLALQTVISTHNVSLQHSRLLATRLSLQALQSLESRCDSERLASSWWWNNTTVPSTTRHQRVASARSKKPQREEDDQATWSFPSFHTIIIHPMKITLVEKKKKRVIDVSHLPSPMKTISDATVRELLYLASLVIHWLWDLRQGHWWFAVAASREMMKTTKSQRGDAPNSQVIKYLPIKVLVSWCRSDKIFAKDALVATMISKKKKDNKYLWRKFSSQKMLGTIRVLKRGEWMPPQVKSKASVERRVFTSSFRALPHGRCSVVCIGRRLLWSCSRHPHWNHAYGVGI